MPANASLCAPGVVSDGRAGHGSDPSAAANAVRKPRVFSLLNLPLN